MEPKTLGIGSKGWRRTDRRLYDPRSKTAPPLRRAKWELVYIVGETSRAWICQSEIFKGEGSEHFAAFKVPKAGKGKVDVYFRGEDVERAIWAEEHEGRIRDRMWQATLEQLQAIAAILGYEPAPRPVRENGEPWLIAGVRDREFVDHAGNPVDPEGRPK